MDKKEAISVGRGSNCALPEDIIISKLLVKLPVESLVRLRCVSKSWLATISSPYLIQLHMQHAKKRNHRLLIVPPAAPDRTSSDEICMYMHDGEGEDKSMRRIKISFATEIASMLLLPPDHANGLLLLNLEEKNNNLLVCNPSTRECILLPECSHNVRTAWQSFVIFYGLKRTGIGFVPSTNNYKIVNYFYRHFDFFTGAWSIGMEVFTLGIDSCWRTTREDPPYLIDARHIVSVGQFIYFKIDNTTFGSSSPLEFFFSFNLEDEKFRVIHLPRHDRLLINPDHMSFVNLEGEACFLNLSLQGTYLDVWMYKYETVDVWTHTFTINLQEFSINLEEDTYDMIYPVAIRHGKVLLFNKTTRYCELVYYDPQTESFEKEVHYSVFSNSQRHRHFYAVSCMDTLVPIK